MVFEDRGEDLHTLTQRELAERAADFYTRFISRAEILEESARRELANPSFRGLVDLHTTFSDRIRDADNAMRHYGEAKNKALATDDGPASQLYERRLEELAEKHAHLAELWDSVLRNAGEQNIFLPGGALLLAQEAKGIVEESLPTIRRTITRLVAEASTAQGLIRGVSEQEKHALELSLRALQIQCQEGHTFARNAVRDSSSRSRERVEAEQLIGEFEALIELLTKAYEDAERSRLLPSGGNG